jgi:D-inositol-3-phosphate glycosyltransferase
VAPHDPDALADALARILDDPRLAARLSEAGQRHARAEYTREKLAERVSALYGEVLSTR